MPVTAMHGVINTKIIKDGLNGEESQLPNTEIRARERVIDENKAIMEKKRSKIDMKKSKKDRYTNKTF